ncbi:MAG: hypothetical protein NTV39_01885 [Candidatus Saccharibacteria bacterium]|nr:hypothetical protein [Candidatus Saccharibacteria bacterium]
MIRKSTALEDIVPTGKIEELESLAKRRRELLERICKAEKVEKDAIDRAKAVRAAKTKPLGKELKSLDSRLALLLFGRKRYFWARFGKTIKLADAVITYRTVAKSLDTPKNVAPVINFLRNMRGGNRFLTWTPSLNRDAITNSGESLQSKLKPLGAWVGRHAIITIKTTGQDEPTTLDRRRFPNRR